MLVSVYIPRPTEKWLIGVLDDAEVYDGAPVGLQIVGRKFQEEKMLAIATVIKAALDAAD